MVLFFSTDTVTLLYCISRKTVDTEYTYYSWCMTSTDIVKWRKKEWLWKFWKRNDLYENFEKRGGVVEKRGVKETKSMPHAPVVAVGDKLSRPYGTHQYFYLICNDRLLICYNRLLFCHNRLLICHSRLLIWYEWDSNS